MNYRLVIKTLGLILIILAFCMLPSLIVGLIYKESIILQGFAFPALALLMAGLAFRHIEVPNPSLRLREGFLIVALTWTTASLICAVPFVMSGAVPDIFTAIYEATSGITTTGGSAITNIEALPVSINFWRGFTHWMGGLGVLTVAIAIFPALGVGGFQIAKAESANLSLDKVTPRISDMAKLLYFVYFLLTAICVILLLFGGMNLMDALIHAFSAIATGGFSSKNTSIAFFQSGYIEVILMLFMFIGGINFPLTYLVMQKRKLSLFWESKEFRLYALLICIVSLFIFTITVNTNPLASLRSSFFHVISLMTTTGFASTNYELWPSSGILILFAVCFIGGCSGSTTGGIKCIRLLVTFQLLFLELKKRMHPRAVYSSKIEGHNLSSDTASNVLIFVLLYILCFMVGTVVISFDPNADLSTAISASAASLNNVGLGFAQIGPTGNYGFFAGWTKLFVSFLMILGRLELFTMLLLFTPYFWTPDKYR